ncbi:pyruvate decarboxylase [Thozetella sp. PMI_491]|nr:pyruvate decarboxylase [Thozetella sp. PMI_491]
MADTEILIGQYLFRRLKELGIETIFGVPGDYELALLDLVEPEGLSWVGTPNELVGAYAADGYARQKGAGALVTTFGPGELSALCGIGGAYCESVPVIHIAGYPTNPAQKSGKILHHTIGDGSYEHYVKMSAELSCATAVLKDPATAVYEIDRVLNAMLHHSKPAYLGISEDVAYTKVSPTYLDTKLIRTLPSGAQSSESRVVSEIIKSLEAAKAPILIVDGGASPYDWSHLADELIEALKIPVFCTVLGKGLVNEESPYYYGPYCGIGSYPNAIEAVSKADVILWLGSYPSDFNTGMFTEHVESSLIIDFQRFHIKVGNTVHDARTHSVLPKLIEAAKSHTQFSQLKVDPVPPASMNMPELIEQDWLWERLSTYLKPGDLVVSETGTSQVGIVTTPLPRGAHAWTQAVYGSIGYAAGAAIGGSIAAKETGKFRRLVLVTGEGSLQLTVQAFSILNRHGVVPVVFILNNAGYTVERYFCGMTAKYNDVPNWDYCALFRAFSPEVKTKSFKVGTATELDSLLNDTEFNSAMYPQCVEMLLGKEDCPSGLKTIFEAKAKGQKH